MSTMKEYEFRETIKKIEQQLQQGEYCVALQIATKTKDDIARNSETEPRDVSPRGKEQQARLFLLMGRIKFLQAKSEGISKPVQENKLLATSLDYIEKSIKCYADSLNGNTGNMQNKEELLEAVTFLIEISKLKRYGGHF